MSGNVKTGYRGEAQVLRRAGRPGLSAKVEPPDSERRRPLPVRVAPGVPSLHRRFGDWSLRIKLTLTLTALVVGVATAITLLSIHRERRTFESELQEQADLVLRSASVAAADALYYLNIDYLTTVAAQLAEVDDILYVRFYDRLGHLLVDSRSLEQAPGFVVDQFGRRLVARETATWEWHEDHLVVGISVRAAREPLGAVTVALSTDDVQAKIAAVRNQGLAVALLAVVVGTLLLLLMIRPAMHRLGELVEATQRIDGGDLRLQLELRQQDELGVLARSFNDMIGRLQKTLEHLRESEERYALATRGANDALWDWDLITDHVYYSPRWRSMLDLDEAELSGTPEEWFSRIHPKELSWVEGELAVHLLNPLTHFENEHRIRHRDGSYRWVLCRALAVQDESGRTCRIAGSLTDITERKRAEERLAHAALHDDLTSLPNRALLMDRLERALASSKRREGSFAVLFIDLDRFKWVNDSLGHAVGDRLLIEFAQRAQSCLRSSDTLARLGGDEFVVLLELVDDEGDALLVADRVLETLDRPFSVGGREVFTRASLGIVSRDIGYERPEEVLRDADIALYRAKMTGKSRHVVFDVSMREHAVKLLQLETDLRRGLERDELVLYYQPIVALATGAIVGFEALLRWRHPRRGLLSPQDFLEVALEAGLSPAIDSWVLQGACRQIREWRDDLVLEPSVWIGVNLFSSQFARQQLVEEVQRLLAAADIDAASLRLEITEGAIVEDTQAARRIFAELRTMGVGVALDDFGTGYSSLSYLHQFAIQTIKIDLSFIQRLEIDRSAVDLVRTIIKLASDLGLGVIAEGVETPGQLERLRALGCKYGQGFLFSRPREPAAVPALMGAPMLL